MKLNTPLPQSLTKECNKAAKIFRSFVDHRNQGLDGIIPRSVLERAKGFAIFSVFKAGFIFSARAGSGIVIAKLADGTWSAPSAIGTAGMGFGGQAGAEVTDFLIVLNSHAAVKSFMAAGTLTLGGNVSVALGPLGRNGEASSSVNTSGSVAMMYSYSKTKGLFGGLSVEGSVIVERQDANVKAYRSDVTVKALLSGSVPPPPWAHELIKTIEHCTGMPGGRPWVQDRGVEQGYIFGGVANPHSEVSRKNKLARKPSFPPASWGRSKSSDLDAGVSPTGHSSTVRESNSTTFDFPTRFDSDQDLKRPSKSPMTHSRNAYSESSNPFRDDLWSSTGSPSPRRSPAPFLQSPSSVQTKSFGTSQHPRSETSMSASNVSSPQPHLVVRAIALFDFKAVEPGDLAFSKGDVIVVIEKSDRTDDWWTGIINGQKGIFPANFVELV